MKKYKQLQNTSVRLYKHGDFKEVFDIFVKFQKDAKIGTYYNTTKGHSDIFVIMYLIEELKKLIQKSEHSYVGIDNETGKIWGFACFTKSVIRKNSIDLQLTFKDPDYYFNRVVKGALLLTFKKVRKEGRIFAALGPREKFNKYIDFVKRIFKIKVIGQDNFNRIYVEFL